ncbi:MAG: hypothetical protein IJE68_02465 [Clostridia bacterium]|nr:hypothetical protein [Clostridia bacterium]
MKNIWVRKILTMILITLMVSAFGVKIANAAEQLEILSIIHLDTNLDNKTFYTSQTLHIEGWKLATQENTKLVVSLNDKEIDNNYIKYSYKYDLISIVQGYGTYNENPAPNFDIDIPLENYEVGNYKLKIEFKTEDDSKILKVIEKQIQITRDIKHILQIDTKLEGEVFYKDGIEIKGWKLATEADTKLIAKINGQEVKETKIEMYYAYDLISIVQGYGTYQENPTPNYTINIPTTQLSQGKHQLEIQFVTYDGIILEKVNQEINIDKSIKHVMHIDTVLEEQSWSPNGIDIKGWKLSTESNTSIVVYIGNRKIENINTKYEYLYDLISIVKGYGTYKENPTPNFSIHIPVTEFKEGDNTIKIQFVTEQGEVLEERTSRILEAKSRIHIEYPFDRTTITNETHSIEGWVMTTASDTKIRLLIDGYYRDEEVKRYERQDVLNAIKDYGDYTQNPLPGFKIDIDFSKFSLGLHQIALRIEKENGAIVGEQVIYIFLRRTITYEEGTYGESGLLKAGDLRGSKLRYYRYGDGPNVLFTTFAIHGFEDNWEHDGQELVYIAERFYETLKNKHYANYGLADEWTIYILPEINPDGVRYGTTNNGKGRTTLYSAAPGNKGIDLNRSWKTTGFDSKESNRHYAGTAPFQAYEAQALRDFLISHKSRNGQTILVDLHGWYQQLVGDREVGMYYAVQFPENHGRSLDRYGDGYLIDWARTALASNGRLAKTSLIELPKNVYSHQDVIEQKLAEKYIHATLSMLNGII